MSETQAAVGGHIADMQCVGYFEGASQEPSHWPATDAPCPICREPLGDRGPGVWKCRNIAPMGGVRSYFIAYHADCPTEQMDALEPAFVDEIFAWDDAQRRPQ